MATEYTVALRNLVSGPAKDARRDAIALRETLGELEARPATVRRSNPAAAQGIRQQQRATAAREKLIAREVAARERGERQMLAAELRRINTAQRAEERAAARDRKSYLDAAATNERLTAGRSSARRGAARGAAGSVLRYAAGGVAAGAGIALAGAGYAANQGVDTAHMIESARMRLSASLGDVERANREIKDAFKIAEKTIFDPKQMLEVMSQLSTNFKDDETRRYILGAVSDFATVSGKGNEGMESAIRSINQIYAKGKLQQEELTGQLGELGLPARKVYEQLAVLLGVKGKTDKEKNDKVIKLITAGKVDEQVAIQAITKVMRDMAGGGAAGSFAKLNADTLESTLSNIKNGFSTLFVTANAEQWPAFQQLKFLLKDIANFFSTDSQEGQYFMWSLNDAMTQHVLPAIKSVREQFAAFISNPERMNKFITGLATVAEHIIKVAQAVAWLTEKAVALYGLANPIAQKSGDDELKAAIKASVGLAGAPAAALPSMASGGVVPGPRGRPRLIEAHGGEVVSGVNNEFLSRVVAAARPGGGGHVINLAVNMSVQHSGSAADLEAAVERGGAALEMQLDRYFGRFAAQGV